MEKVKTFPLHVTESHLDEIGKAAKKTGETKQEYILNAVKDRMEKDN